jgi:hypothetical protein
MPTIRTTIEPWRDIAVTEREYLYLLRAGLIYDGTPPPPPPPSFSDQQYAELADPEGEAAERVTEAVIAGNLGASFRDRATHTGLQTSATIADFTEAVQDAVAALLAAGTGVTLSYNDTANTLTVTGTTQTFDAEAVRDTMGLAIVSAGLITVTVNDALDTITIGTTATANSTDAQLRDRSTHSGTQTAATISDFAAVARALTASTTVNGTVMTATTAEAQARSSTAKVMTPANWLSAFQISKLHELALPTAATPMNGQRFTGLGTPASAGDSATKGYVDGLIGATPELAYAESTATVNLQANTAADVPGVAISFVMPSRPVMLTAAAILQFVNAGQDSAMGIYETTSGSPVLVLEIHGGMQESGNDFGHVMQSRRITGTAGVTRTFKVTGLARVAAWSIIASATFPTWLQATVC